MNCNQQEGAKQRFVTNHISQVMSLLTPERSGSPVRWSPYQQKLICGEVVQKSTAQYWTLNSQKHYNGRFYDVMAADGWSFFNQQEDYSSGIWKETQCGIHEGHPQSPAPAQVKLSRRENTIFESLVGQSWEGVHAVYVEYFKFNLWLEKTPRFKKREL